MCPHVESNHNYSYRKAASYPPRRPLGRGADRGVGFERLLIVRSRGIEPRFEAPQASVLSVER